MPILLGLTMVESTQTAHACISLQQTVTANGQFQRSSGPIRTVHGVMTMTIFQFGLHIFLKNMVAGQKKIRLK